MAVLLGRTGLIICASLALVTRSPAPVICDGPPTTVALNVSNPALSVLSTNTAVLSFTLGSQVGNDTRLGLGYSGNAKNGVDVQPLPAFIIIPSGQTSGTLIVSPKTNYPFSSKNLTVTITNSDNVCVLVGAMKSATITLAGFNAPRLEVTSPNPTDIVLAWSAAVPGYVLQSAGDLTSASWLNVTNMPVLTQGTNRLTLVNESPVTFYRLLKP